MTHRSQPNEPHVKIGIFSLWVKSGPDSEDWLEVLAACDAPSATITASGCILQLSDLRRWLLELEEMNRTLTGNARLGSAEPNIDLSFNMTKLGNIDACLEITPDYPTQLHKIGFECDQSHLPALIRQLNLVITKCSRENT
jgi:hypothetical protein